MMVAKIATTYSETKVRNKTKLGDRSKQPCRIDRLLSDAVFPYLVKG